MKALFFGPLLCVCVSEREGGREGGRECVCGGHYSWEVLVEVGLHVVHSLHGQLHGVDSLVGQARVEETTLHMQSPHHRRGSTWEGGGGVSETQ